MALPCWLLPPCWLPSPGRFLIPLLVALTLLVAPTLRAASAQDRSRPQRLLIQSRAHHDRSRSGHRLAENFPVLGPQERWVLRRNHSDACALRASRCGAAICEAFCCKACSRSASEATWALTECSVNDPCASSVLSK